MVAAIEQSLGRMKAAYSEGVGARDLLKKRLAETETALDQAKDDIDTWEMVQALFRKTSEYAREQLKLRIEETVTAALQAVIPNDDLEFQIFMGEYKGQPTAEWRVISRYGDMTVEADPEDARGGGITDVVSLALRVAMMELTRPRVEGPVVWDEPGKMVSAEYAQAMAQFVKTYAQKTGRQIFLVTHNPALADAADMTYWVNKRTGESEVVQQ